MEKSLLRKIRHVEILKAKVEELQTSVDNLSKKLEDCINNIDTYEHDINICTQRKKYKPRI